RGKKSCPGFGALAKVTFAITCVSPRVATTEPSAWRATFPVSSVSVSLPHWMDFFVTLNICRFLWVSGPCRRPRIWRPHCRRFPRSFACAPGAGLTSQMGAGHTGKQGGWEGAGWLTNFARMRWWRMATMNISLPDQMKSFAEEQARGGRYANVSDYMRDLIRRDQARQEAVAGIQRLVDEAMASGP